jgi:2-oxoglutarate-Fe(II)-dependent oxygenase superfamily protein
MDPMQSSQDSGHLVIAPRLRSAPPAVLEDLRGDFSRQYYVSVPGFVEGRLLEWTFSELAAAEFEVHEHPGDVGAEWQMKPNALYARLNWLMNAPELVRVVRDVTGLEEIGWFSGRIHRLDPASGHSFTWHDDRGHGEDRLLAVSVNLTERPYAGGVLSIRRKRAPDTVAEVPKNALGGAVLFRVADELEHCVTPVTGEVPRLTFTGWFRPGPAYYSLLRGIGTDGHRLDERRFESQA